MIDWINQISYTGFYHWLIATVHPLVMIVAVTSLALGAAFYYTRRVISSPAESRAEAHLFPAVVIPIWTIFAGWVYGYRFWIQGRKRVTRFTRFSLVLACFSLTDRFIL